MLPTFENNQRRDSSFDDQDHTSFVDALSDIEATPDLHAETRYTDRTKKNEDIKETSGNKYTEEGSGNVFSKETHQPDSFKETNPDRSTEVKQNDGLEDAEPAQENDHDTEAEITELLAPFIANLSINNPGLYDQLIQTIDQNRMLQNVLPDEDSEFEKIQQLKKEMKNDLEADWNAVDPVQFLGEEQDNDDYIINDDISSAKSGPKIKSFGTMLQKIGIGTSDSEEDNEKERPDWLASSKSTSNNRVSYSSTHYKPRASVETKPESITGKFTSAFKKSIGLEDDYDPTSHTNHDINSEEEEIELSNLPIERRISGDSILNPHATSAYDVNSTNQKSETKISRPPTLMHKLWFKYNNERKTTEKTLRDEAKQGTYNPDDGNLPSFQSTRPKETKRSLPKKIVQPIKFKNLKKVSAGKSAAITVHITTILQKQRFMIRLCKALMLYGAPSHRLEDYLRSTSQVLEIDGQFLYLPGCMIISFDNTSTTSSGAELQLVKCNQGVNLWKLHKVYKIYKLVIHDMISLEEANNEIDAILVEPNLYNKYCTVLFYGLASAMVTPFAFGGDWINIAISFIIGSCVGILQFLIAPKCNMYSNVFEITASIVVSFCARALGSIPNSNICFGSVAQGSLALILPGYIILCGSLELQNKSLLSGSVRMVYAIIYSLFLSFGITLGAALFAWCYNKASNETTCSKNISDYYKLLWVPSFSVLLALINQAHWSQLFVMTVISCTGYLTSFYSAKHFTNATEFCSALAAFVIGLLGNLYSRVYSGLAVSAILPAIFVQVPSGIASKSSLLTGVQVANEIVNGSKTTQIEENSGGALSFGVQMVQVAIGVTVGLFASTLVIYPFGKQKTGIFTL